MISPYCASKFKARREMPDRMAEDDRRRLCDPPRDLDLPLAEPGAALLVLLLRAGLDFSLSR
jgi:hypothetical protein